MALKERLSDYCTTIRTDPEKWKRLIGITVFTLAFPSLQLVVQFIPNPMVPGAIIALNMILPVLAGYFYGPRSGAFVGGVGTGITAVVTGPVFMFYAIIPHTIMGAVAGWTGKFRSEFLTASTILVGHFLNIIVFTSSGLLVIPPDKVNVILLGLASESMVDIAAIVLVIHLLKRNLYCQERW